MENKKDLQLKVFFISEKIVFDQHLGECEVFQAFLLQFDEHAHE